MVEETIPAYDLGECLEAAAKNDLDMLWLFPEEGGNGHACTKSFEHMPGFTQEFVVTLGGETIYFPNS